MTLRVEGIRKRLGGRRILDDISFTCRVGEIAVLTGHNGAGKSTLLSIVAGVLEPDRGFVDIAGMRLSARRAHARRQLGYVPEAANPPGHMTPDELFAVVSRLARCRPLSPDMRQRLNVDPVRHARIERLSLGERRRVCLAAALIGDPRVLVLDEPTNGLDVAGVATLAEVLDERRDSGTAILIATHDHAFADALADVHLRMDHGRLLDVPADPPGEPANAGEPTGV